MTPPADQELLKVKLESVQRLLNMPYSLNKLIDANRLMRLQVWSIITKVTPSYSLAPGGGSDNDKMASQVAKLEALDSAIASDIDRMTEYILTVRDIINHVENIRFQTLLIYRYLDFRKFPVIASDMDVGWRRVFQIHYKALKAALNVIEENPNFQKYI